MPARYQSGEKDLHGKVSRCGDEPGRTCFLRVGPVGRIAKVYQQPLSPRFEAKLQKEPARVDGAHELQMSPKAAIGAASPRVR
jgi:hypothetical protein